MTQPTGPSPLHALLARLIVEGAHSARCCRRTEREAVARVHQGLAAEAHMAAVYVADLIVTGRMREPGYQVTAEDVAAAQRVADSLTSAPEARVEAIDRAIYGTPPVEPSESGWWSGGRHTVTGPVGTAGEDPPDPEYEPPMAAEFIAEQPTREAL